MSLRSLCYDCCDERHVAETTRPVVDAEFEANRQATIAALSGPRYDNVRDGVERAQAAFSEIPPDGKGAIRNTFAAAEGLFKLLLPSQNKLNGAGARSPLKAPTKAMTLPQQLRQKPSRAFPNGLTLRTTIATSRAARR